MIHSQFQIHATAVEIGGLGIILVGQSTTGKSDLALRLIDRGASLISDDIVRVRIDGAMPHLYAAPNIAGKLEVRGLGIVTQPFVEAMMLRLVVNLDQIPERMPDGWPVYIVGGYKLPSLAISAFEASAPIKVERAVKAIVDNALMPVAISAQSAYNG